MTNISSVKSATLGFTNSKCWLLGLSLNDVFLIIFLKLNLGSKIIFKIQDDVEGPVHLILKQRQAGELSSNFGERPEIAQPTL